MRYQTKKQEKKMYHNMYKSLQFVLKKFACYKRTRKTICIRLVTIRFVQCNIQVVKRTPVRDLLLFGVTLLNFKQRT